MQLLSTDGTYKIDRNKGVLLKVGTITLQGCRERMVQTQSFRPYAYACAPSESEEARARIRRTRQVLI